MFRLGTNIIGVGDIGASAVEYARNRGIDGTGYACVMAGRKDGFDLCCDDRTDFVAGCDRLFVNKNGVAYLIGDFFDRVSASLMCEICAVAKAMGSLTVAVVYMPYSGTDVYEEAQQYVDELHELADGVVIINSGYCSDINSEIYTLLRMLSGSMSTDGAKYISSRDELKDIFTVGRNMYFTSVCGYTDMDSHRYHAKTLAMRLGSQMHLDIASNFVYFATCGCTFPKDMLSGYVNSVEKMNIAYMPVKRTYIFENNPALDDREFLFGVLCSE